MSQDFKLYDMDYDDYPSNYVTPGRRAPPPVVESRTPSPIIRQEQEIVREAIKQSESKTDDALKALRDTSAISRDETAGNNLERQRLNVIDEAVSAATKGAAEVRRIDDQIRLPNAPRIPDPSRITDPYDVQGVPAMHRSATYAYPSRGPDEFARAVDYRDPAYYGTYSTAPYRDPYYATRPLSPQGSALGRRDPYVTRRDPYIDPYDDYGPYYGSNPFAPARDPYRPATDPSVHALPPGKPRNYDYDEVKISRSQAPLHAESSVPTSSLASPRPSDQRKAPLDSWSYGVPPADMRPIREVETEDDAASFQHEQRNGDQKVSSVLPDVPGKSLDPNSNQMDELMRRIELLQQENESLKRSAHKNRSFVPPPETYKTFYCIDRQFYLDEPQWELGDPEPILRSTNAISQIDYYLHQHPEILFIFRKTYQARPPSNRAEIETRDGLFRKPVPFDERLELTSNRAKDAVEVMADLIPDFFKLFPRFNVKSPIKAPYLFMYHSEPFMDKILPEVAPEYRRVLALLRSSINSSYGAEYASAKEHAKNGRVSRSLFKYLIKPGDILVHPSGLETAGYEAIDWPDEHKFETVRQGPAKLPLLEELLKAATGENPMEGKHEEFDNSENVMPGVEAATYKYKSVWTVRVVYWTFDGNLAESVDYAAVEMLTATKDEVVSIKDLNIYPLEYASTELRDRLQKRGEMFWMFRLRRFVSYNNSEENLDTVST